MKDDLEGLIFALEAIGCRVDPCGSRVTCSPPPENTDEDYLVEHVAGDEAGVGKMVSELGHAGFTWEGGIHYQTVVGSGFMSWRKGSVNIIATCNKAFAAKHRVATALCKRLNLMHKPDRIALFQAVLYGNQYEENAPALKDPMLDIKPNADDVFPF